MEKSHNQSVAYLWKMILEEEEQSKSDMRMKTQVFTKCPITTYLSMPVIYG